MEKIVEEVPYSIVETNFSSFSNMSGDNSNNAYEIKMPTDFKHSETLGISM